jgi:multiple sugar transport system substrate-binding protein
MNRRIVWSLIALVAIVALSLSACAGAPQPAQAPVAGAPTAVAEGTAPAAAPVAGEEGEVTLTIWDFGGVDFQWLDDIIIPAYQETHPNIKFNHVGVPEEELALKLETAVAAGEVPDLVVFAPARLVPAGHILLLNENMAAAGLKPDDYCPLFSSRDMIDDKVFSLPISTNQWATLYNKDAFKAAGLPELGVNDVMDFDQWLEYTRALNKPADNLQDRVWGSNLYFPIWNSMNNYMSDPFVVGKDGKTCVGNADTDDWVHVWEVLKTAYEEDLTTWSGSALLADVQENMFNQGKIGMTEGTLGEAIAAREAGINVGMTGQPVVTKGWQGNVGGWNTSYSIMAGSKHPVEAWEFLKYMSTDGALLVAGKEGEIGGVPCYLPVAEEYLKVVGNDPLVVQSMDLMKRIIPPPFTPDIWGAVDPFNEAWRAMTEDNADVREVVNAATEECQEILDQQWTDWDALSQ